MANFYAFYPPTSSTGSGGGNVTIVSPIGQTTMAASVSVAIASDQSAVPVSGTVAVTQSTSPWVVSGTVTSTPAAATKALLFYNDYSITPVTTAAYVQVVASTAANIRKFYVFDSSGSIIKIATGAAASEVDQFYIQPGGNTFELTVASGTRLSIEALAVNATSGVISISATT